MATVPQPAPAPPPPQHPNDSPSVALSWEGERMFNVYIYDYCFKRGFRKTARELMAEADLPSDSTPPINARQGLLFEWWSVFWVLFTAKSSGTGTEDAMLYAQYQAHRQAAQRLGVAPPIMQGTQPQPPMPPHQHQSSINRMNVNGVAPRSGLAFPPNAPMANGVNPGQPPGGLAGFPMTPTGSTSNGIPGQHGVPQPPGSIPANQPPGYPSILPGQRLPVGMPPQHPSNQQRPPNGPPFQSPNMANSPQNPPNGQQSNQPPQSQQHQPPMNQLNGPSPHMAHMNRPPGMHPGMNSMNTPQGPPGQPNAPTPGGYPQPGQPPSRTGTPGQVIPSPSLAARQAPGANGQMMGDLNTQVMSIPNNDLQRIKSDLGIGDKELNTLTLPDKQRVLSTFRSRQQQKPGGGPPDNPVAGPSNSMMQIPNSQRGMQQQQPQQHQRNQPTPQQMQQQAQQQAQHQRQKRNSTSPGDEDNLPRTESSPPDRKRMRRSPMEGNAPIPYPPQGPPQQPGQPQQSGMPQSVMMGNPSMMMGRSGGPMMGMNMNGGQQPHPGQPGMGGPMNMAMAMGGGQGMGGMMGGGMNPSMGPPLTPHMHSQQAQAREAIFRPQQQQQLMPKQGGPMGGMGGNAGSPAAPESFGLGGSLSLGPGPSGGPGFNPGLGPNRMGQQKGMMPPPSPAMNGAPKDQAGTPGPGGQNPSNKGPMNMESPRNPPMNAGPTSGPTPNVNGGPLTPVPPTPQNQNPGGQGPGGPGGPSMAASPSSLLGPGPPPTNMGPTSLGGVGGQSSLPNPAGMPDNIFGSDFMNSVASSLDEFDPNNMFRPDGDINFERDFGQWFNPDDVSGLDAMK